MQQSIRKEKLRKVGLCFITGYFITTMIINMTINHFFVLQAHLQQNIYFLISG